MITNEKIKAGDLSLATMLYAFLRLWWKFEIPPSIFSLGYIVLIPK